jgi:hypothetical protein
MASKVVKEIRSKMAVKELKSQLVEAQSDVKQIYKEINKGRMDSYSGDLAYAEGYEAGLKFALNIVKAGN